VRAAMRAVAQEARSVQNRVLCCVVAVQCSEPMCGRCVVCVCGVQVCSVCSATSAVKVVGVVRRCVRAAIVRVRGSSTKCDSGEAA